MTLDNLPENWQQAYQEMANSTQSDALKRFYQAGVKGLGCPLEEAPLVALDIETTGLDSDENEIVSIGLVSFSLQAIKLRSAQ